MGCSFCPDIQEEDEEEEEEEGPEPVPAFQQSPKTLGLFAGPQGEGVWQSTEAGKRVSSLDHSPLFCHIGPAGHKQLTLDSPSNL